MAKVQNPVIGRTKGSAGGMTFAKVYDKNVMKAKVFEANNPNTASQQVQRNYFKTVSAQSSTLSVDALRAIFPSKPKGISRRNAFFRQLVEYWQMVSGVKTMKLSDLMTVGNAPTMNFGTTTASVASGAVTVELDAAVVANDLVKNNYFIAFLVNDTKNLVYLDHSSNKVQTGTLRINLPQGWEDTDTVHAIPLITNVDGSTPIAGFGSFIIKTRPEKKSN